MNSITRHTITGITSVYLALAPTSLNATSSHNYKHIDRRPKTEARFISCLESGILLETRKGTAPISPGIPDMDEESRPEPPKHSYMPTPERLKEIGKMR